MEFGSDSSQVVARVELTTLHSFRNHVQRVAETRVASRDIRRETVCTVRRFTRFAARDSVESAVNDP